jgi:hypothetical protein
MWLLLEVAVEELVLRVLVEAVPVDLEKEKTLLIIILHLI